MNISYIIMPKSLRDYTGLLLQIYRSEMMLYYVYDKLYYHAATTHERLFMQMFKPISLRYSSAHVQEKFNTYMQGGPKKVSHRQFFKKSY